MKATKFLLLGILGIFIFYFIFIKNVEPDLKSDSSIIAEKSFEALANPVAAIKDSAPGAQPSQISSTTDESLKSTFEQKLKNINLPTLDQYRNEVASNSHTTPNSIKVASLKLGELYDQMDNEKEARRFINFTAECVQDHEVEAIQVLCLKYAEQTSRRYKSVRNKFKDIQDSASDRVKSLYKFIRPEEASRRND